MVKTPICGCGKVFSHKAGLSRHRRVCAVGRMTITKEVMHICANCMKSFGRKDNYTRHSERCLKKKLEKEEKEKKGKKEKKKQQMVEKEMKLDIVAMCAPLLHMLVIKLLQFTLMNINCN